MYRVIHIIHWYVLLYSKYYFYLSLVCGLVCSALLKKLSNKAQNVKEHSLSSEFAEHARQEQSKNIIYRWCSFVEIYHATQEISVWVPVSNKSLKQVQTDAWLIDYIVFDAVSTIFRPYDGGPTDALSNYWQYDWMSRVVKDDPKTLLYD